MNTTFYIKRNDTLPPLISTIKDKAGDVIDLTGMSALFIMRSNPDEGTDPKISAAATVIDGPAGRVQYDWATGDTADSGTFRGEFQFTNLSGDIFTAPNDGYLTIKIKEDLGPD